MFSNVKNNSPLANGKENIMKVLKIMLSILKVIGKIICMPIMIIIKVFLLLMAVLMTFALFVVNACTWIAGTIVNLIMLFIGAAEIVGIGVTIYHGEWEYCLAIVILLMISAVVFFIPIIAELVLEWLSELSGGLMVKALDMPVILDF